MGIEFDFLSGLRSRSLIKTTESLEFWIDPLGNNSDDGSVGSPFLTLPKGIEAVRDSINHDCILNMNPGTYPEASVVKKITTTPNLLNYLFIKATAPTELLSQATADAGTRTTLTDTGRFVGGPNNYAEKWIEILAGPNYVDTSIFFWFTNFYPIRSNNDDVLTLGCSLSQPLSNATEYRVVENNVTIEGDGTNFHFGLSIFTPQGLEVHVQNIDFTKSFYGINNYGRSWAQGCAFIQDTVGYSGIFNNAGGFILSDGCRLKGAWSNSCIGNNAALNGIYRQNYIHDGKSGVESDSSNFVFLFGNVIDTMTDYGVKSVNSGLVQGSNSINTTNQINNCAKQAFYSVGGGKIIMPNATGSGNNALARTIGPSDVFYDSSKITGTNPDTFDDVGGRIIDAAKGTLITLERTFGPVQSLLAADPIDISNYSTERIAGNGGAVTLTSTPNVAGGLYDGQELTIEGTSDPNTVTLQDESVLGGSGLQLSGGINMTLGQYDIVKLKWNLGNTKWIEISRSDN